MIGWKCYNKDIFSACRRCFWYSKNIAPLFRKKRGLPNNIYISNVCCPFVGLEAEPAEIYEHLPWKKEVPAYKKLTRSN